MILFSWRRLPPPGFIGGAEISEGLVARSLAAAGEQVTFVGSTTNPRNQSETWRPWLLDLLDRAGIDYDTTRHHITYRWHDVDCHAVPQDQLLEYVRGLATTARMLWTSQEDCPAIRAAAPRLPAASYAHSVSKVGLLSAQIGARWVFAPSRFVQRVIHDRFGQRADLLRPPLDLELMAEPVSGDGTAGLGGRDLVLFVNPIRDKGVELAVELARRFPSTRFVFVESWRPADPDLILPANVELLARMPSLTGLYQRALLLLVPSVIDDACPRVILEAGAHGAPALGADRGGIPELIADPANVLPATGIDAWAARCRHLLASTSAWSTASHQQRDVARAMHSDPVARLVELQVPLTSPEPSN